MGGVVSSIFGGGQSSGPSVITYEAEEAPREAEQEAESQSIRDEEQRKLRRRQQMGGTVLTSPLGTSGGVASTGSSLLGRIRPWQPRR